MRHDAVADKVVGVFYFNIKDLFGRQLVNFGNLFPAVERGNLCPCLQVFDLLPLDSLFVLW